MSTQQRTSFGSILVEALVKVQITSDGIPVTDSVYFHTPGGKPHNQKSHGRRSVNSPRLANALNAFKGLLLDEPNIELISRKPSYLNRTELERNKELIGAYKKEADGLIGFLDKNKDSLNKNERKELRATKRQAAILEKAINDIDAEIKRLDESGSKGPRLNPNAPGKPNRPDMPDKDKDKKSKSKDKSDEGGTGTDDGFGTEPEKEDEKPAENPNEITHNGKTIMFPEYEGEAFVDSMYPPGNSASGIEMAEAYAFDDEFKQEVQDMGRNLKSALKYVQTLKDNGEWEKIKQDKRRRQEEQKYLLQEFGKVSDKFLGLRAEINDLDRTTSQWAENSSSRAVKLKRKWLEKVAEVFDVYEETLGPEIDDLSASYARAQAVLDNPENLKVLETTNLYVNVKTWDGKLRDYVSTPINNEDKYKDILPPVEKSLPAKDFVDTKSYSRLKSKPAIEKALNFYTSRMEDRPIEDGQNKVKFDAKTKRAFYRQSEKLVSIQTNESDRTVIHELGHWLEFNDPIAQQKAKRFFVKRTKNEKLQSLQVLTRIPYGANERAYKDDFLDAYIGKEYGRPARPQGKTPLTNRKPTLDYWASELLSMGMEYMAYDTVKLAKDKEYFKFIYDIMGGY
jgi:hypothetical protein